MDVSSLLSSSIGLVIDLVKDVEAGVALHSGDTVVGDSIDVVEVILADANFKAHLAALVASLKV